MNGLIKKAVATACLGGVVAAGQGCYYYDVVDPCWPERYSYQSRQTMYQTFGPQVHNGHVLDQTIWNLHFEAGTDRLTAGGMDHLAYLARRRPHPDPMIYLQTAYDVTYDAGAPEQYAEARSALGSKRTQAIRNYLNALTSGRGLTFEVTVHDPSEVGMAAERQRLSILQMHGASRGVLPTASSAVSGGGGVGGGGGGGAGG